MSQRSPSNHLAALSPFLAMEVMERAMALERAGQRVIHLEIGEPDFAPPAAAIEAGRAALATGRTKYTASVGLPELREAIAADKGARSGVAVDPECVLVTSGTSPALLMVIAALCERGSELVVPAPHYACYPNFARFVGAEPVPVPCDPAAGFAIDPDAVKRALTPRTRAIVVGTPANPTGAVQSRETMRALAGFGVPLVSDEIYDGLVYDGVRVTSALEVAGDAYVLDGFSKRYAMTGFRLGYAIAPRCARCRRSSRTCSSRRASSCSTRGSRPCEKARAPSRLRAPPTPGDTSCQDCSQPSRERCSRFRLPPKSDRPYAVAERVEEFGALRLRCEGRDHRGDRPGCSDQQQACRLGRPRAQRPERCDPRHDDRREDPQDHDDDQDLDQREAGGRANAQGATVHRMALMRAWT